MMDDLVAWLRAQLDREERDANLIPGGGYRPARWTAHRVLDGEWAEIRQHELPHGADDDEQPEVSTAGLMVWGRNEDEHVARWDPARIVAEVEAKRQILVEIDRRLRHQTLKATIYCPGNPDCACHSCLIVKALALPYAGEPGYREEWRP